MTTLKEYATAYEPPQQTKNIAELDQVHTSVDIQTANKVDKEGQPYSYSYIEKDGEQYRVPNSVITQLQTQLEVNPHLLTFKVVKKGAGMDTKYTLVPLASGSEKVL